MTVREDQRRVPTQESVKHCITNQKRSVTTNSVLFLGWLGRVIGAPLMSSLPLGTQAAANTDIESRSNL